MLLQRDFSLYYELCVKEMVLEKLLSSSSYIIRFQNFIVNLLLFLIIPSVPLCEAA